MRFRFKLAAAWRFLTIFPLPWWRSTDEGEALRQSLPVFPLIGICLGMCIAIVIGMTGWFVPPLVNAALAVIVMAAVSGGLHLDGLADSADALLSPGRSREKALEIMKDSRLGAHGALGLVAVLLLKFACLASIPAETIILALLVAVPLGRTAMMIPMALLPYAREQGLGGIFDTSRRSCIVLVACAWSFAMAYGALKIPGLYALGAWLAVTFSWTAFLWKRLRGATGDSYGAACELAETAVLLGIAIAYSEIWW